MPTIDRDGVDDANFRAADYMTGMIPGAKKVVIHDTGQASNLDQPEAFNRALGKFSPPLRAERGFHQRRRRLFLGRAPAAATVDRCKGRATSGSMLSSDNIR